MFKAGLSTDKIVNRDVAVNCRMRALELFNQEDSYLSDPVDPVLTTYIATLQSILEKNGEGLETRAKLQEEWDLARKVAIKADPSIDTIRTLDIPAVKNLYYKTVCGHLFPKENLGS